MAERYGLSPETVPRVLEGVQWVDVLEALLDGPFDDYAHRPDVRRASGTRGLYNIPNVNLFLYRHYAYPLAGVTPFRLDSTHYALDPSGRDVPLYQPGADHISKWRWQP